MRRPTDSALNRKIEYNPVPMFVGDDDLKAVCYFKQIPVRAGGGGQSAHQLHPIVFSLLLQEVFLEWTVETVHKLFALGVRGAKSTHDLSPWVTPIIRLNRTDILKIFKKKH
jgi:hypothetical protein